jgi:hypothetical protein
VKKENFGYLENKYGFEFNVVFKKWVFPMVTRVEKDDKIHVLLCNE